MEHNFKKGDKVIYELVSFQDVVGYYISKVDKVLKTKIKLTNGMNIFVTGSEVSKLYPYSKEKLEEVKERYKQTVKKLAKRDLQSIIKKSKVRLDAVKEALEEVEREMNHEL